MSEEIQSTQEARFPFRSCDLFCAHLPNTLLELFESGNWPNPPE